MKSILIFLLYTFPVCRAKEEEDVGIEERSKQSDLGDSWFIATIWNIKTRSYVCMGPLITPRYVLTCAVCITRIENDDVKILDHSLFDLLIGNVEKNAVSEKRKIGSWKLHRRSRYNKRRKTWKNNFAMVTIRDSYWPKHRVKTLVPFHHLDYPKILAQRCYTYSLEREGLVGLNASGYDWKLSRFEMRPLLLSGNYCSSQCPSKFVWCQDDSVDENEWYGIVPSKYHDVLCQGGIGSPIVCSNYIVGMITRQSTCIRTNCSPVIFSNIEKAIDWVLGDKLLNTAFKRASSYLTFVLVFMFTVSLAHLYF